MKKIIRLVSLLLCAAVLVMSASGCTAKKNYAVDISGAKVDYEIFLYFLDKVHSSPESYSLDAEPSASQLKEAAVKLCKEYVAVNTKLADMELSLTPAEKSSAASNLDSVWHIFSKYYEKLGVSKQSMMKIMTSGAARDRLFKYIYGEGGEKAIPEQDIKTFYDENYLSFRAISGYLTTVDDEGKTVTLSDAEKQKITDEFNALNNRIKNGQSMTEVMDYYSAQHPETTVSDQLQFIKKSYNSYPNGFFDKVSELKDGESAVVAFDEYIFLVVREQAPENEAKQYYEYYRTDCMKSLRGAEFDSTVTEWADGLDAQTNDRAVRKALKEVLKSD